MENRIPIALQSGDYNIARVGFGNSSTAGLDFTCRSCGKPTAGKITKNNLIVDCNHCGQPHEIKTDIFDDSVTHAIRTS